MSTQPSLSANQSPAAAPAPSPEATPPARPAGILPMPAQLLAASEEGSPRSRPSPAKAAQQDSAGCIAVPTTGGGDNATEGPLQNMQDTNNMANTKEKTPMCLLNELARFNKLQPKYELTSEKGPPHQKLFTVSLTLGAHSYESFGPSIKKAQHGAAAIALEKCGLPHPVPRNNPPKFRKRNMVPNTNAMTPTVKLNSLAMKTGKEVQYQPLNPLPPRPYYHGGYRGPRGPHPNQQGMPGGMQEGGQGQGQAPPTFHAPAPPQMPPPPMPQAQAGMSPPQPYPIPIPSPDPSAQQHQPVPATNPGPPGNQQQTSPQQHQPVLATSPGPPGNQQQTSPQQQQQGGPTSPQPSQPPQQLEHDQQQQHPPQSGGPPFNQQHAQQPGGPPFNQQQPQQPGGPPFNQHQRPYYPRYPRPYIHLVKVMVGDREFVGEGKTQKGARQNAAARALMALESEPSTQKVDQATSTNIPVVEGNGEVVNGDDKSVKSDISLVYEAANLHGFNVVFEVLEEKGQPHLKMFKLKCIVGEFCTQAEGASKKEAKRKAAEVMLPKLKTLPPVAPKVIPVYHMQRQLWRRDKNVKKKKSKSLVKMSPADPNFGAPGLHPVSRLVQILQAKNEREPEFSVIEERPLMERAGPHMVRRREFTIQVSAASKTATGKGKTKKDAKKLASENMLKVLGYSPTPDITNGLPGSQPSKSALKTNTGPGKVVEDDDRKVTFKEDKKAGKNNGKKEGVSGKGLAPGLLPMMPGMNQPQPQIFPSGPAPPTAHKMPGQGLNRAPGAPVTSPQLKVSPKSPAISDVARDLLSLGHSPTAEALLKGTSGPHAIPNLSRPTQQLEYLAKVNTLSVRFNDFPPGPKGEIQSVVYLSTEPQSAFRGSGPTMEAAHDAAAITALRVLAGITDSEGGKKASGM